MTVDYYLGRGEQGIHEFIVTDVIIAIDIYLVAVVLLIFSAGIYRLFVSPVVILAVIIEFSGRLLISGSQLLWMPYIWPCRSWR